VIPIERLPAAARRQKEEEIRELLAKTKDLVARDEELGQPQTASQSVAQAISGENIRKLQIEDDTHQQPEPAVGGQAGDIKLHRCPRCDLDLGRRYEINPTPSDLLNYKASLLGAQPFQKVYSLYDGEIQVTFRELFNSELDAILQQCMLLQRSQQTDSQLYDPAYNQAQAMDWFGRYRLALQITGYASQSNDVKVICPKSLKDWVTEAKLDPGSPTDPHTTPLAQIYAIVADELLKTETMARILYQVQGDFNRLLNKMEANRDTPGFLKRTS
jgi:hypothetical protein